MLDHPALRSARTLFALVACTAMISTAAACSSDSEAGADDPRGAETTTTTLLVGDRDADDSSSDPVTTIPTPADDDDAGGEGGGGETDGGGSQAGSLPGDFPAIPLPEYDRVDVVGTGQMGSGKYSGRATFTLDSYRDRPLQEMIDAYGDVLVNAGFSPLELDDEGSRIRGWSTQPGGDDSKNEVDITVYKDRPGELEIGGAHWEAIGL